MTAHLLHASIAMKTYPGEKMIRNNKRGRWWILLVLLAGVGITSMNGCIVVDRDHHWHHHW